MKSLSNFDYYVCFIDNSEKLNEWENHLSLQKLMFQKIIKKSMSTPPQTYGKTGGGRTFRNRHGCSEKQIIIVFVKKALVFMLSSKSGVPTGTESHEGR